MISILIMVLRTCKESLGFQIARVHLNATGQIDSYCLCAYSLSVATHQQPPKPAAPTFASTRPVRTSP